MKNSTKILANRAAFTLLELSIVVAIIGLLAGAIVATQSFMRSSKLTAIVNDVRYYHAALLQFDTRYSAIPGDMTTTVASNYWPSTTGGDGNNLIAKDNSGGNNYEEMFYAWRHLGKSGLINGVFSGVAGSSATSQVVPGTNAPTAPINQVGYIFKDLTSDYYADGSYFDGYYRRPIFVAGAITGGFPSDPVTTPREGYQLDEKYDDTVPGTGNIRTRVDSTCVIDSSGAAATSTSPTTARYVSSSTAIGCSFIFTLP